MGFYEAMRFFKPSEFFKWINRYHWRSEELQSLAQSPPKAVFTQTIDLSSARLEGNPLAIRCPGRGFVIYGFTTATITTTRTNATNVFVNVRIGQDKPEFAFPAKHNRGYRGDFLELYLSWPAQSGISCDLVIHQFDDDPWEEDAVAGGAGSGTVTSVAATVPAEMAVSGSPIVGAGTLAFTWANESANQIFVGPASGAAAVPTFRQMVMADFPTGGSQGQILDVQSTGVPAYRDFYDITQHVYVVEDFLSGYVNTGQFGGTNQTSGAVGGTGATLAWETGQTAQNPGVVSLSSGTTTTGYCFISGTTSGVQNILLGGGITIYECIVKLSALSDGTNTYSVLCGLGTADLGTTQTNGVYFQYSSTINSGQWTGNTSKASVATVVNSAIAATTNFVRLKWVLNAAGTSVEFFVDGVSIGTSATNIPTTGVRIVFKIEKSAGTTARLLYVDAYKFFMSMNTPR